MGLIALSRLFFSKDEYIISLRLVFCWRIEIIQHHRSVTCLLGLATRQKCGISEVRIINSWLADLQKIGAF